MSGSNEFQRFLVLYHDLDFRLQGILAIKSSKSMVGPQPFAVGQIASRTLYRAHQGGSLTGIVNPGAIHCVHASGDVNPFLTLESGLRVH